MLSRPPKFLSSLRFASNRRGGSGRRAKESILSGIVESKTHSSGVPPSKDPDCSPVPTFESLIQSRRRQAARSLVVQVKSKYSAEELFLTCQSTLGYVDSIHFFAQSESKDAASFYIVEFKDEVTTEKALYLKEGVQFFDYSRKEVDAFIPVRSPFTWFYGGSSKESSNHESTRIIPNYIPAFFPEERPSIKDIPTHLSELTSLDSQMMEYHRLSSMLDISTRIRFLACRQLELSLGGLFGSFVSVLPFGSSVNSFGSCDSDLDMVLHFSTPHVVEDESKSRLYFHVKGGFGHRNMSQMYIRTLSNLLQDIIPGCRNVQNISNARVPILKYHHQLLGLECDLSASSLSGVFMSELLYLFGEMDVRVRPLVLVIRRWAKEYGLVTNTRPTKMFTNFTITLLVIFFLQHHQKVLPSVNVLRELADSKDIKVCVDGVQRDFLTDISGYQSYLNSQYNLKDNKPNLESLLKDFFEFYGDFDFKRGTLCINSGQVLGSTRDHLHVINPLEPHLNVSANVSSNSVTSFQSYCKRTLALINANPSFQSLFRGRVSRNLSDLFPRSSPKT